MYVCTAATDLFTRIVGIIDLVRLDPEHDARCLHSQLHPVRRFSQALDLRSLTVRYNRKDDARTLGVFWVLLFSPSPCHVACCVFYVRLTSSGVFRLFCYLVYG